MKTLIQNTKRFYLIPILFVFLSPLNVFSQSNDGCPPLEFIVDGCVLCNEDCQLFQTGAISVSGQPCFVCECPGALADPLICTERVVAVRSHQVLKIFSEKGTFPMNLDGFATILVSDPDPVTRVIQTEILSMELTGTFRIGKPKKTEPVNIKIGRSFGLPPSTGSIVPITPHKLFPAESFFDVFIEIEVGGLLLHNETPFRADASLSNTPAQAAFNDDGAKFSVDVFGTEFELVETAGGAEAAYTGLNYVFQDFWEFLEEGEKWSGISIGSSNSDFFQSAPNPFSNTTRIFFSVSDRVAATLVVYNMAGQQLATLFDGIAEEGEMYEVDFDGTALNSGAYIYRFIKASGEVKHGKLILHK